MNFIKELKEKTKTAREKIKESKEAQMFLDMCEKAASAAASRGFDYVDTSFQYIDEEEEETLLLADICIQILEEDYGFRVQRGTPHRISPFGYKLIIRLFW
jgi:hypothetical protein